MKSENEISKAEEILYKIFWRTTVSGVPRLEQMVSWGLGGVGAVIGLLVANIDSISKFVPLGCLRWTIVFLALSFLCGAVGKILAVALTVHLEVTSKCESFQEDPKFKELLLIASDTIKPDEFVKRVGQPFWGPLSKIFSISANRTAQDTLFGEKLRIKIFCWFSYLTWAQFLFAILGVFVIALAL